MFKQFQAVTAPGKGLPGKGLQTCVMGGNLLMHTLPACLCLPRHRYHSVGAGALQATDKYCDAAATTVGEAV